MHSENQFSEIQGGNSWNRQESELSDWGTGWIENWKTWMWHSVFQLFVSLYLCATWGCPDDSNGIQHEYVDLQRLCQQHFGWEFLGWTSSSFLSKDSRQFLLVPESACTTKETHPTPLYLTLSGGWHSESCENCIYNLGLYTRHTYDNILYNCGQCETVVWNLDLQVFNVAIGGWHIWCYCQRQSKKMLGVLVRLAYQLLRKILFPGLDIWKFYNHVYPLLHHHQSLLVIGLEHDSTRWAVIPARKGLGTWQS